MSNAGDIDLQTASRVDRIVYALVKSKYATLAEIRDTYSVNEVLDLYEIYMVNAYNKYAINQSIKH